MDEASWASVLRYYANTLFAKVFLTTSKKFESCGGAFIITFMKQPCIYLTKA